MSKRGSIGLVGFAWLAIGLCSLVQTAEAGGRFSLTGSVLVRSIDGAATLDSANVDITEQRWSHQEFVSTDSSNRLLRVPPDPYGYNLGSKLFIGGNLKLNMRLWRRLELALALEGYLQKSGAMELTWFAQDAGYTDDMQVTDSYESTFLLFNWRLLLEYHTGFYGLFAQAGLERVAFCVEEWFTRDTYVSDTLDSHWRSGWNRCYFRSAAVVGAGWLYPLADRWKLVVAASYATGDMTGGVRVDSGLRYQL